MTALRLIEKLSVVLQPDQMLSDDNSRKEYSQDKWPRWLFRPPKQLVDLVVRPRTVQETAFVLATANREKIPVIPYGGGSGVCGAVEPQFGGIALDLKNMRQIGKPKFDPLLNEFFVAAQTGVMGDALENELQSRGFTLGHFPASIAISTLGGWIAAGSSGQCSTKYGNMEKMTRGLEVVFPDGGIKWLSGSDILPFIGSEGTLGVIASAQLRIFPLGGFCDFMSFAFPNLAKALDFCSIVSRFFVKPAVLRLYDSMDRLLLGPGRESNDNSGVAKSKLWLLEKPGLLNKLGALIACLPLRNVKPLLLVVFDDAENAKTERKEVARLAEESGAKNLGERPSRLWWRERYKLNPEKLSRYFQAGVFADTLDVAGPIAKLPELYRKIKAAMSPYAVVLAHFSHFFDNRGCIYFTIVGRGANLKQSLNLYEKAWRAGLTACLNAGGDITHHHGIGVAKLPWFKMTNNHRWEEWQKLKNTVDPNNIMNPGKLMR